PRSSRTWPEAKKKTAGQSRGPRQTHQGDPGVPSRPGRPVEHRLASVVTHFPPADIFCCAGAIADMNVRRSLSSCFLPMGCKMTGKSRFQAACEHLTTSIFSEN